MHWRGVIESKWSYDGRECGWEIPRNVKGTYKGVEGKESRLDPRPMPAYVERKWIQMGREMYTPVKRPCNSNGQYSTLPEVLDDHPSPVVLDPTFGDGLGKGYADTRAEDEHGIG